MIKKILKVLTPPIFFSVLRRLKKQNTDHKIWSGDYVAWTEAQIKCVGYNSDLILDKCKSSMLKVKNGDAVYERDSVLFDEIQYSWGLLAGLQRASLENDGKLCVLDFGGSLGSSYYQNKDFLKSLKEIKWCIIEQPHFVKCGKEFFEDDKLKFYNTVEECISIYRPNVLLLSGILQYLENPHEWIEKFVGLEIPFIIIDRTTFVEGARDILTIQIVPESIYPASYPAWFFNQSIFEKTFRKNYSCLGLFPSHEGLVITINNLKAYYKGMIWKAN